MKSICVRRKKSLSLNFNERCAGLGKVGVIEVDPSREKNFGRKYNWREEVAEHKYLGKGRVISAGKHEITRGWLAGFEIRK